MEKTLSLDSYKDDDIKQLVEYGLKIVEDNKEKIHEVC